MYMWDACMCIDVTDCLKNLNALHVHMYASHSIWFRVDITS